MGNSPMAMEHALMKKGSMVRLVCTFFISLRSMMREVASMESEKVNAGIDKASVIVLVIAFFIPVMRLTLSCSVMPVRGAILTPVNTEGLPEGAAAAAWLDELP